MADPNKRRFIQNGVLLLLIVGLALFLSLQNKAQKKSSLETLYDEAIGETVTEITIHVEGRDDILLKNLDDVWKVVQPVEFIADNKRVQQLFTLLSENAESKYRTEGKDLAEFGLDEDRLSITFNQVKFIFGKYNAVSQKRYLQKADTLYLVSEAVTGLLQEGVDAFRVVKAVQPSSE